MPHAKLVLDDDKRKITSNPNKMLYLSPDSLLTHPKNMRRFYPEEQVAEIADSIRAAKGVYQAMLIVPNGKAGKYFVVDGNMRLASARLLGKECPPLKCELITASKAEQLLSMVATAKFRYDPDPISEALHYKRLMDEERYNPRKIADATGVNPRTIETRLRLLNLDPEIQELVATCKLPVNWVYFNPARVGKHPHHRPSQSYDKEFWAYARRLVKKRQSLWGDEWWSMSTTPRLKSGACEALRGKEVD